MIYTYTDAVLTSLVTEAIETEAIAEIDALRDDWPDPWRERLIVLKVYVMVCLEYASTGDDPFTLKLGQYSTQFNTVKDQAEAAIAAAAAAAAAAAGTFFSVPLERG